jgi:transcriptional regulator with XRE-family HTH domain
MPERITKLKILLLESDKPQYKIAADCGMHPSQLSAYALGQHRISIKHLRALAKYFRCSQQDIVGWEEIDYERSSG